MRHQSLVSIHAFNKRKIIFIAQTHFIINSLSFVLWFKKEPHGGEEKPIRMDGRKKHRYFHHKKFLSLSFLRTIALHIVYINQKENGREHTDGDFIRIPPHVFLPWKCWFRFARFSVFKRKTKKRNSVHSEHILTSIISALHKPLDIEKFKKNKYNDGKRRFRIRQNSKCEW